MEDRQAVDFSRREFLRLFSAGAAGVMAGGAHGLLTHPGFLGAQFSAPLEINLRAATKSVQLKPGVATQVMSYEAELLQGTKDSLQTLPETYLGPIIRAHRGQRVIVHFTNTLSEPTVVHWHGLNVPDTMDGGPQSPVAPGATYTYDFVVINRAGTYWFHPHPDMLTGPQVLKGMAGLFIVQENIERVFGLPRGEFDVPLILQDRSFDANNQFRYNFGMEGFLGNTILVNGKLNPKQDVAATAYRLRVLNGSNARTYKLAWQDGASLTVIASDGGLLSEPVRRAYVTLSPGERVDLWVDFSNWKVGSSITLRSLAFSGVGMGSGTPLTNGTAFDVMAFNVASKGPRAYLRPRFLPITPYQLADAVNLASPKVIDITFQMNGMMFLMNGRAFEMEVVAADEVFQFDQLYLVEFANESAGMIMGHPMHYHGAQFQVLDRSIQPARAANYETIRHGYVDTGWKDTVLVSSGERVRTLMKFTDYTGLFVYHCHILEHEDDGMMRHFRVDP